MTLFKRRKGFFKLAQLRYSGIEKTHTHLILQYEIERGGGELEALYSVDNND